MKNYTTRAEAPADFDKLAATAAENSFERNGPLAYDDQPSQALQDVVERPGRLVELTGEGALAAAASLFPKGTVDVDDVSEALMSPAAYSDVYASLEEGVVVLAAVQDNHNLDESYHEGLCGSLREDLPANGKIGRDNIEYLMLPEDRGGEFPLNEVSQDQAAAFGRDNPTALVYKARVWGSTPITVDLGEPVKGAKALREAIEDGHALYVPDATVQKPFKVYMAGGASLEEAAEKVKDKAQDRAERLGNAMTGWGMSVSVVALERSTGRELNSNRVSGYFGRKGLHNELGSMNGYAHLWAQRTLVAEQAAQRAALDALRDASGKALELTAIGQDANSRVLYAAPDMTKKLAQGIALVAGPAARAVQVDGQVALSVEPGAEALREVNARLTEHARDRFEPIAPLSLSVAREKTRHIEDVSLGR